MRQSCHCCLVLLLVVLLSFALANGDGKVCGIVERNSRTVCHSLGGKSPCQTMPVKPPSCGGTGRYSRSLHRKIRETVLKAVVDNRARLSEAQLVEKDAEDRP